MSPARSVRAACLPLIACVLLATSGADVSGGAPASGPASATAPAEDLCNSAIDPLDLVEEFIRFSVAAGDDRELSEEEFQLDRARPRGFVRSFDRWESLLRFDGGGPKGAAAIDWTEAQQYRGGLKKAVLGLYDANGDGQLTGPERQAANQALAEGNVPTPQSAPEPAPPSESQPASAPSQ